MNMTRKLTIIINKEKKGYVATSVELGVVSQGKTIEKAQENLKEALELYLENNPKAQSEITGGAPLITTLDLKYT
jgi:predicted RNase H-like HicB family nuclease